MQQSNYEVFWEKFKSINQNHLRKHMSDNGMYNLYDDGKVYSISSDGRTASVYINGETNTPTPNIPIKSGLAISPGDEVRILNINYNKRDRIIDHKKIISFGASEGVYPITLKHGVQNVTAAQDTPFNVLNIEGRTLINYMGRQGGFNSQGAWASDLAIDSSVKKFGSSSGKIDNSAGTTYKGSVNSQKMNLTGKHILHGLWAKAETGTTTVNFKIRDFNSSGTIISEPSSGLRNLGSEWTFLYQKYDSTAFTGAYQDVFLVVEEYGTASDVVNFDGMVVYELSQAEYNTLATMTNEQIAEKYPYVDDAKALTNPYVVAKGKNLLPPFSQWTIHANAKVIEPYKLELNPSGVDDYSRITIPVFPNTVYNLDDCYGFLKLDEGTLETPIVEKTGTFTTTANTKYLEVRVGNQGIMGLQNFTNPMFNIGNTALPFEPQNDDALYLQTALHSDVGGTVYDSLSYRDGKFYKTARFAEMLLDGSVTWAYGADYAGHKVVHFTPPSTMKDGQGEVYSIVKFDGKIINNLGNDSVGTKDVSTYRHWESPKKLLLTIPDSDSGWGETWAGENWNTSIDGTLVTGQESLKIFFNGWKHTGNPVWTSVTGNGQTSNDKNYVLNNSPSNYTPYRLIYQLANSVEEQIPFEGALSLHSGDNQVQVGEAVVVREHVVPAYDLGSQSYNINAKGYSSRLKYPEVSKFLAIYENGKLYNKSYTIYYNDSALGDWIALGKDIDPKAIYTVTYIAEPYTLSSSVDSVTAEQYGNTKKVLDMAVQSVADLGERVGTLEIGKANKGAGAWIEPTLLNGWVRWSEPIGFYKDDMGVVRIKGRICNGNINKPSFYLPKGYRPLDPKFFITYAYSAGYTESYILIDHTNGSVTVVGGVNTEVALDNITFRAEQ